MRKVLEVHIYWVQVFKDDVFHEGFYTVAESPEKAELAVREQGAFWTGDGFSFTAIRMADVFKTGRTV